MKFGDLKQVQASNMPKELLQAGAGIYSCGQGMIDPDAPIRKKHGSAPDWPDVFTHAVAYHANKVAIPELGYAVVQASFSTMFGGGTLGRAASLLSGAAFGSSLKPQEADELYHTYVDISLEEALNSLEAQRPETKAASSVS